MQTKISPDLIELKQGSYWRARAAIPEQAIEEGMVLLLESIRDVDQQAHTIILRAHPSIYGKSVTVKYTENGKQCERNFYEMREHRFLVADFLNKFVEEHDFARIRQAEVAKLQAHINDIQQEMAQSDTPDTPVSLRGYLVSGLTKWAEKKQLPAGEALNTPEVAMVPLSTSLSAGQVEEMKFHAERQHELATIKANWIKERIDEIGATVTAMSPYYKEQAAAALAKTEDVRRYVQKLQAGIESLDLYVGTGVDVKVLRKGQSAPDDTPLTIAQRKLYADEELSVYADVTAEFDHSQIETFFDVLGKEMGLADQIFPSQRSVVAYAVTRRTIDYKDIWSNMYRNAANRKVGLLIRDGENIYNVVSPIDSHLLANNLFPGKDELDAIFRENVGFFNEGKYREITFNDVRYTDKLNQHEAFALHYKRFLILLAGLDHRENLFGTFYPGPKSLDFISQAFQSRHLRFIYDDTGDGMLPTIKKKPLGEWIDEKNSYLRSGSRVLCSWKRIMNHRTAPGAVKYGGRESDYFTAYPVENYSVVTARSEDEDIVVTAKVQRRSNDKEFGSKVSLSKWSDYAVGYLVLDAVKAEEMEAYIHDREARRDHLGYIQFFKHAVAFLRDEEKREAPIREALRQALSDGRVGDEAHWDELIDQAIRSWRADNRGADTPTKSNKKAWTTLLDLMYTIAAGPALNRLVRKAVAEQGYENAEPLRLVVTGANKLALYVAPKSEERDDRCTPHVWVHKFFLYWRKNGDLKVERKVWDLLPAVAASETTLFQWDEEATKWAGLKSPITLDEKNQLFEMASGFQSMLSYYTDPASYESFSLEYKSARRALLEKAKYVANPVLTLPFGVGCAERTNGLEYFYICLTHSAPHRLLYDLSNDAQKKELRDRFIGSYKMRDSGVKHFDAESEWEFSQVPVKDWKGCLGHSGKYSMPTHREAHQRSLNHWLSRCVERWRKNNSREEATVWFSGEYDFDAMFKVDTREKQYEIAWYGLDYPKDQRTNLHVIYKLTDGKRSEKDAREAFLGKMGYSSRTEGLFYTLEDAHSYLEAQDAKPISPGERFHAKSPDIECWVGNEPPENFQW